MKSMLTRSLGVLVLAGAFCLSLQAQTAEESSGPSEQPSAPMEMGQPQSAPPADAAPPQQPYGDQQPQAGDQQPGYGADQQSGAPPQMGGGQGGPGEEAQPGGPSGEGPATIDQGVGRVSLTHGAVSTQRGDSGDWSAAVNNQPVVGGDKVSTGDGGRAEVQLDFANILRLAPNSQANIANFTKKKIQIQVAQGRANYTVFGESEIEPEIDTPSVTVHPAHENGVFRVEVQPDGDTIIIVRKGEAQISTPQGIENLKQGDMATVRGTGSDARYKVSPAPDRDDWDEWNAERDHMIHSASGWQHTNKYYVGSEDLDANGRWENADDYGQVWVPNEPQGWAPYRDGNWTYEPYYGWTWVGGEPWGWAPYHYGRWMSYGGSWAWWPGPVWGPGFYRPFWAPAYVSFFGFGAGFGAGFGLGFGWGGFGWLPLGPCDWFHPWWGGYGGRFGAVGFNRGFNRYGGIGPLHSGTRYSNLAHINEPGIGRGLSTVGARQFGAGRVSAVAASREQLGHARLMTGNMPVIPSRASLSASGRAASSSTIHNGAAQHFSGTQSAARPVGFQQETAHLQQSMQQNHVSPTIAGERGAEGRGEARGEARGESRGNAAGMGKPSTGAQSGRETNNSGTRSENNSGSRTYSGAANARAGSGESNRSGENSNYGNRGEVHTEANSGGWRSFNQQSRGNEPSNRGAYNNESAGRSGSGSYWDRTAPSSNSSRGSGSSGYGYGRRGGESRPQLNMRQPIVQPRSGYGGSYGGYRGSQGYGPPSRSSPGYSSPSHSSPSHSSPGYGGNHGGYSGGGSHSAPSSGGHSKGFFGGGHSSGSGHFSSGHASGGHSSGGHSSHSGGGHSGGGGHGGGGGHHR